MGNTTFVRRNVFTIHRIIQIAASFRNYICSNLSLIPVHILSVLPKDLYAYKKTRPHLDTSSVFAVVSTRLLLSPFTRIFLKQPLLELLQLCRCLFRRLALSANMRKHRIDTVRLKLLKIVAKVIRSASWYSYQFRCYSVNNSGYIFFESQ